MYEGRPRLAGAKKSFPFYAVVVCSSDVVLECDPFCFGNLIVEWDPLLQVVCSCLCYGARLEMIDQIETALCWFFVQTTTLKYSPIPEQAHRSRPVQTKGSLENRPEDRVPPLKLKS